MREIPRMLVTNKMSEVDEQRSTVRWRKSESKTKKVRVRDREK